MNTVNTSHKKSKKNFVVAGLCIVLFLTLVFAFGSAPEASAVLVGQTDTIGDYKTLTPLGGLGISPGDVKDLPKLLTTVFRLMLGAAAALSVLMITLGGIEYLSTDTIFGHEEGKKRIKNALYGLALAISAYLILYTINPKTLEFNFNPQVPTTIITNTPDAPQTGQGAYYKVSYCVLPAVNEGDLEEEIIRTTNVVGTYVFDGVNITAASASESCENYFPIPGEQSEGIAASHGCSTETIVCTTSRP